MYKIDFDKPCRIHFIGIGGISMSGFAEYLHNIGYTVTGSDAHESKLTKHLTSLGIQVSLGQRAANITDAIDLVVYTAAIRDDNEELIEVRNRNIPLLTRAELIGQLMLNFKNAMTVAGTHGKTTTTSILSTIFMESGMDPTISVGAVLDSIGGTIRTGKSEHFILEACEYTDTFLEFHPKRSIILNIDADHLDYFKDLDHIRNSFRRFAQLIPQDGQLFINGEIDNLEEITEGLKCEVFTYGIIDPNYRTSGQSFDYAADHISFDSMGNGGYDLSFRGQLLGFVQLGLTGLHNISNSLGAIAMALQVGVPLDKFRDALRMFHGAERRFEVKGTIGGVTVVDDYAHHPTEVTSTLTAAQAYPHKNLWCVFQPHTYSRLKAHRNEFARSLTLADKIIITDIYAAREKNPGDVSSMDLVRDLEELGKEVYYFSSFDEIENFLLQNCINGDLLITMGAGDVVMIGEALLGL